MPGSGGSSVSTGHLIDRPVQARTCPRCNNRVLVAIDAGTTISADPDALDIHAEAKARITGLVVVDLERYDGRRAYLRYRNTWRMRRPRTIPVLAQHQCPDGTRPLIPWETPGPDNRPPPRPRQIITTGKVPF
jgi:hypothetical protein